MAALIRYASLDIKDDPYLSPPGLNGRHFPDDIFKCIFMNEKFCALIRISLMSVPKCPINNILALA